MDSSVVDISVGLPTFVITLREGVEAALVVGIVLALLHKAQQSALKVWVYVGLGAGLFASLGVGAALSVLLQALQASQVPYATLLLPLLKFGFTLTAIALLTWMLIWMTQQARTVKAELEGTVSQLLTASDNAAWGVGMLIFVAVLREGIETALFITAQAQGGWSAMIGAIAGLITATAIGWMLFALGVRVNLKGFFQGMGILLLLIVGGLVLGACKQLDLLVATVDPLVRPNLCWTAEPEGTSACILGALLWNAHSFLPDNQFPGLLLKTFLGYRDRLFVGQALVYLSFMSVAGTLYWRSLHPPNPVTPLTSPEGQPQETS